MSFGVFEKKTVVVGFFVKETHCNKQSSCNLVVSHFSGLNIFNGAIETLFLFLWSICVPKFRNAKKNWGWGWGWIVTKSFDHTREVITKIRFHYDRFYGRTYLITLTTSWKAASTLRGGSLALVSIYGIYNIENISDYGRLKSIKQ